VTHDPAPNNEDETHPKPWRRRLARGLGGLAAVLLLFMLIVLISGWRAFGKAPEGERRARMEASAQWVDDSFVNPQPIVNDSWLGMRDASDRSDEGTPAAPLPVVETDPRLFAHAPTSGLRVTWLGHSTMLVEIDGFRVLTDPVWGRRTSPLTWAGPARWYAPPLALEDLPELDAVVISHDHYDHLDYPTIVAMKDWDTTFLVPLGVAAHLEYWGVPTARIVELDWWEEHHIGGLTLTCVPARHASGRQLFDKDRTLWAGYTLVGPQHRVFFSGDTGLFPALTDIGERLGPFDLTMIEVGAYGQGWPDWHLGPEQAVEAHTRVRGELLLPVHWGLFDLAYHGWTEPIERVLVEARARGTKVVSPRPGESFEPATAAPAEPWWPALEWRSAEAYPIAAGSGD